MFRNHCRTRGLFPDAQPDRNRGRRGSGLELAARLGRRLDPCDGPRQVLLIDRAVFNL